MTAEKAPEKAPDPKVNFSDLKSKQTSRKTKVTVISILTVILLLGAVVSVAVFFTLKKATPSTRLTEINLKEGDTLTYQVDQEIEVNAGNAVQKGT